MIKDEYKKKNPLITIRKNKDKFYTILKVKTGRGNHSKGKVSRLKQKIL
jgi:hypothetical protein